MKKLGIVLGVFIALILGAIIVIPLVVDVDRYRPQVVEMANGNLNGKLAIGKLKLSLWGQIRIQADGITLDDARGRRVLSVKDVYFHLPFAPILSGSPVVTLRMDRPELMVFKDKGGTMNLSGIAKQSAPSAAVKKDETPAASGSAKTTLPAIVVNARLGMEMRHANVVFHDESKGADNKTDVKVSDLNVILKDISILRPTQIEVWADLDTKMGKAMAVKGPIRFEAQVQPKLGASGTVDLDLARVGGSAMFTADDLEIDMPGTFHKAKGVPAHFEVKLAASQDQATIEKFSAKFHNVELAAKGSVKNLPTGQVVDMELHSNEIVLQAWEALVPALKGYDISGGAKFDASVKGPIAQIAYQADLVARGVSAKAPKLKSQPKIDFEAHVRTDQLESMRFSFSAPGNDLRAEGRIVSFSKPQMFFSVQSKGLDMDQLLVASEKKPDEKKEEKKPDDAKEEKTDYDAMLEPMRENEMLKNAGLEVKWDIASFKGYGYRITDLVGKFAMKDLVASLEGASLKLWDGVSKANMKIDFKPKSPTYQMSMGVEGLDIQEAVKANVEWLSHTLLGKLYFKMDGSGESFNTDKAMAKLTSKGQFKVVNATFATIDTTGLIIKAVNDTISKAAAKVSQLQGKKVADIDARASRYEEVSSDFTIVGGKFSAPNFVARSAPGQGIDLKGSTTVGLKDYSLEANWELIDTHNMTHARDLSVDVQGIVVEHILAEGDQPVKLPIQMGCQLKAPCPKYTAAPDHFARVALGNVQKAVEGRARAEVQKKMDEAAAIARQKAEEERQRLEAEKARLQREAEQRARDEGNKQANDLKKKFGF